MLIVQTRGDEGLSLKEFNSPKSFESSSGSAFFEGQMSSYLVRGELRELQTRIKIDDVVNNNISVWISIAIPLRVVTKVFL
jgi:hypothetical protein